MISTKKYLIPIIIISALAGAASCNVWLNQETISGLSEDGFYSPVFTPTNQTAIEIIKSPIFRYVGEEASLGTGVETAAKSDVVNITTSNVTTFVIASRVNASTAPMRLDFSGGIERNLKYAENYSSIKLGQNGNWVAVSLPWLVS